MVRCRGRDAVGSEKIYTAGHVPKIQTKTDDFFSHVSVDRKTAEMKNIPLNNSEVFYVKNFFPLFAKWPLLFRS